MSSSSLAETGSPPTAATRLLHRAAVSRWAAPAIAVPAPPPAPPHAGTASNRSVAGVIASCGRTPDSTRAGRRNHQKKIQTDYPRRLIDCLLFFPAPDALSVAPALCLPFFLALLAGPVSLLRFPLRPLSRLLSTLLTAIALSRLLRRKVLFTSLQQTLPPSRPANLARTCGLLIFGMVCRTFT